MSQTITRSEVLAAQKGWADALLKISADYKTGGYSKAKATATDVILAAYNYQYSPVAFKPTLTSAPQTFRPTFEGALSYFVGGNPAYPNDKGFALESPTGAQWISYGIENNVIQLDGDLAISMGNISLTDAAGKKTVVDKTFGWDKSSDGTMRLNLHHSSEAQLNQASLPAEDLRQVASNSSYSVKLTDVLSAQTGWCEALIKISADYKSGGFSKAKATAENVIDQAYNYQFGPVAFKPTLTSAPQTFRPAFDGALSYFVGGNSEYPNDKGFALESPTGAPWSSFKVENKVVQLDGDSALSMGNIYLTDAAGATTVVDKTWGWNKSSDGTMRLNLHHSSGVVKPESHPLSPSGAPLYRFLDRADGSHLFTNNVKEIDAITGARFSYEGIGFNTPNNGTQALYRFYNSSRDAHFYTASEAEKNALVAPSSGYAFEGTVGNVLASGSVVATSAPVYRLFNASSGKHLFTIDQLERSNLLASSTGWASEGVGFYV
ncbi:hypothetical protein [Synechococcus lacustris]|uniref:hypothetical protein n=2 Tax=Synechococcus lacustris TaxID=2116544 RepID=UPI0020CC1BD8|nr:hypothetical protein [Synechococcus lacustris]